MIVIYTVILNNYDNLRSPEVAGNARYICFSDRPRSVVPWDTQPFPMCGDDPRRNSRIPKCLPHLVMDTQYSIYHDGAFRMKIKPEAAVNLLGDADIALFEHPCHKSIHDERNFYKNLHGFVPDDVEAEYQRYVADGLPVTGEFWAGGLIIRRHSPAVERFNETWFALHMSGSYNDQLSLYAAIVKTGVRVTTLHGNVIMDPRFGYCLHANSGCQDNPKYESENAIWALRAEKIRSLCV